MLKKFFGFFRAAEKKKKVLIITGPTMSNKSSIGFELSKNLNGEIINCDSVQIYKYLNIGSNKNFTFKQHLFDMKELSDEPLGSGNYKLECLKIMKKLFNKNTLPIIGILYYNTKYK